MEKEIIKAQCFNNAFRQIRHVADVQLKEYQKQFFSGAMKGFEFVNFVDKKYEEIITDFTALFRRK